MTRLHSFLALAIAFCAVVRAHTAQTDQSQAGINALAKVASELCHDNTDDLATTTSKDSLQLGYTVGFGGTLKLKYVEKEETDDVQLISDLEHANLANVLSNQTPLQLLKEAIYRNDKTSVQQICAKYDIEPIANEYAVASIIFSAKEASIELIRYIGAKCGFLKLSEVLGNKKLCYLMAFVQPPTSNDDLVKYTSFFTKYLGYIALGIANNSITSTAFMLADTASVLHQQGMALESQVIAAMCVSNSSAQQAESHFTKLLQIEISPNFISMGLVIDMLGTTIVLQHLIQLRKTKVECQPILVCMINAILQMSFVPAHPSIAMEHKRRIRSALTFEEHSGQHKMAFLHGLNEADDEQNQYSNAAAAYLAYRASRNIPIDESYAGFGIVWPDADAQINILAISDTDFSSSIHDGRPVADVGIQPLLNRMILWATSIGQLEEFSLVDLNLSFLKDRMQLD